MPLRFLLACCCALLIGAGTDARAQAWPQPRGGLYLKLSHSRSVASEQWDFNGVVKPYAEGMTGNAFFDRSFYLYGEYGLTDNLTFVALLPFKRLRVHDGAFEFETEGLGSVMLGLRVGLKRLFNVRSDRSALALNVTATLPAGYTRNLSPALGPGQADLQAVVSYGLSLYPAPVYAQAGFGFRLRSAIYGLSRAEACPPDAVPRTCVDDARPEYADEWLFSGEVGLTLGRWALLQALGFGVWSNLPPETGFDPLNPLPTRTRYVKAGAGLTVYPRRRVGLSVQYFGTLYGRNTIRSTDWFFGLEYRLP